MDRKVLTPEEQAYQNALDQEADLARLHRTYDLMERDRRLQTENRNRTLVRQEKVLRIYKKEYRNIEKDLKVATAPMRKKEDQKNMILLTEVLQQYDDYDAKIKKLQGYLDELDGQIYLRKHDILDLEAKQTSDRQMHDKVVQARITLEKLENKLELHMKKFCEICYENKKLRGVINTLMYSRKNFNNLWNKLITRLNMGKKFMLDIIEQATLAYDEREEWVSKLKLLSSRTRMIFAKNVQEMRELERTDDNMAKLRQFLLYKGTRRKMIDLEYRTSVKRKKLLQNIELKLDNYRNLIGGIYDFCNEDNVQVIVKTFLTQDSTNFCMFKHLIDINQEMEGLNESLYDLYDNIMEKTAKQEVMTIEQQKKLEKLEDTLLLQTETFDVLKRNANDIDQYLNTMLIGIENIFNMLNCSIDPLLPLLGYKNKIDQFNVLLYLKLIESTVQYLMLCFHNEQYAPMKKKKKLAAEFERASTTSVSIMDVALKDPCPLCIENEMVVDVIDTLQKPMTKKEVQKHLATRLELSGFQELMHNVSACQLPKSREIIQKRYQ